VALPPDVRKGYAFPRGQVFDREEATPRVGGKASYRIETKLDGKTKPYRTSGGRAATFHNPMSPDQLWRFFPIGYFLSILIETPVLLIGLSKRHSIKRRLFAGIWLTACTYPIVVLVMPLAFVNFSRTVYLTVAETFAPVAECILFWLAYGEPEEVGKRSMWQDFGTIVFANLASFIGGEVLNAYGWFGLLG